jgi:uncharacterized membrane protein YeiH
MAFAVTVVFKAIEHKSDIVGIIILSTITGVPGGIIREMILGRIPPGADMPNSKWKSFTNMVDKA